MEEISLLTHFFGLCLLYRHPNYSNEFVSFHARALTKLSIMNIKEWDIHPWKAFSSDTSPSWETSLKSMSIYLTILGLMPLFITRRNQLWTLISMQPLLIVWIDAILIRTAVSRCLVNWFCEIPSVDSTNSEHNFAQSRSTVPFDYFLIFVIKN